MRGFRRSAGLFVALLLAWGPGSSSRVAAQGPATPPLSHKSVHGKLEKVDESLNGIIMVSDDGKRMAWKFDKVVITELASFKAGDPVVVIYRQRGSDKAVTAVGFPGATETPNYVNTTGRRVEFVSGPMVRGACGIPSEEPPHSTTIPKGGQAETADACWCCAPAGSTCTPSNKTGLGRAFLTRCYE